MEVIQIPANMTHEWLLYKHYARRIPSISYAFGCYIDGKIEGIATFGFPPNYEYNNGKCVFGDDLKITTLELNRLCMNDGLPKNTLSQFLSKCFKLLPKPLCIVSYSDPNNGHSGYIYQATNWIYTGESTEKTKYIFDDGSTFDIRRGIDKKGKIIDKIKLLPTHRYLMFLGNKKDRKNMEKYLKWKKNHILKDKIKSMTLLIRHPLNRYYFKFCQ